MRNIWLVTKHEIAVTAGRRSFWLMTFAFPLLILAFTVLPSIMARDAAAGSMLDLAQASAQAAVGYVDEAGIVAVLPPPLTEAVLRRYADETAAQAALAAGEIERYYRVPPDIVASGKLIAVDRQMALITGSEQAALMKYVITYNLVGDAERALLVTNPTPAVIQESSATRRVEADSVASIVVPLAVLFILFFTITMSGSTLLQSVSKEKENRTAEVLLVSLRPLELMSGKVLGLGSLALLQMAIWLGGAFLASRQIGSLGAVVGAALTPEFAAWAVAFFLLGYLTYATGLAALGALAPNMREGAQYTFALLLPLMIPMWANTIFIQDPNGVAATVLSLFPLSAPTAMVARLATAPLPIWQPLVALLGLGITTYLLLRLSARLFRADTLLSQTSLSWARIRKALGER